MSTPTIRVLHVISGLGPGGAETVLFRLITQSKDIAHEVICLGPPDWYSQQLQDLGVPVHHVSFSSPAGVFKGPARLHRLIKSSRADLVQGWMYRGNLIGGLASRFAGKPVVWNIRCSAFDVLPFRTQALAYVGGIFARWIPERILNCSAVSRELHGRIGYNAVDGAVIPNGYDPSIFHPDEAARAATRRSLGLGDDVFLVGTIGRWDPHKGYDVLLRAVAKLRERGVRLRLLFAGRGLDLSNADFAQLVHESGCRELVQAIGHRPDVQEIARTLDLHILASLTEGFPNVVAETMLSGTPNVVTDVGDSGLIVGDAGWVVPAADTERLVGAIQHAYDEWVSSPDKWKARREISRQRIADNYSLDQMVDSYADVWKEVAEARRGSVKPS